VSADLERSAAEIALRVRCGALSAVALAEAALARIAAHDPALGAFTDVTAERALAEAAAVDRKVAAGADPGPLAGVPYAVKNLFDIKGLATRAGSKINRDDPPAARDAVLIERLQAAGAVLIGGQHGRVRL
jgi:aspartyl-tRNA(Asn)/glutamyl-tRNA(Gln) amidotransferase subunit A